MKAISLSDAPIVVDLAKGDSNYYEFDLGSMAYSAMRDFEMLVTSNEDQPFATVVKLTDQWGNEAFKLIIDLK